MLLLYLLFTTGSSAVVLSRILTTCFLAVVPSVFLSHHWLLGCGSVSDLPQRHFVVGYNFLDASPAPPTPLPQHRALRDRWLAVGARAPRSCGLQQRGLRGRCRCGPSVVSNTTPTPLCDTLGCVHLIRKAYIPASCHGVVRRFLRHRWRVIDPRVFFWSSPPASQCHSHCGRVLFLTLLSCIARRLQFPRF